MPESLIVARDLDIYYNYGKSNEFYALKKVNVEIYPQEYIVFFGPSGCGKSTMLYCILGTLPYTFGEFYIGGQDPYKLSEKELVKFQQKTVGIVYQQFNLIPSLNVLDNVALPQIFMGVPPAQRRKRAMELLERFGIAQQAYKLPTMLSGGQQQRVAICRALVNNPDILLADEPVGNLDEASAKKVMETLMEINEKEKKTVILVSHDPRYLAYAHRVYFIRDGRIEREFINPERKQIKPIERGTSLVSETEKLSRLFPYASPEELKVKSIVNYLTQDFTFEQLERLEKLIKLVIERKMSTQMLYDFLIYPFDKGGLEVSQPKAQAMVQKLEKILEESIEIKRFRRKLEKEKLDETEEHVKKLRMILLDQYSGKLEPIQVQRLEEAIEDRLAGYITKEEFFKKLDLSIEKGGAGFKKKTAKKFTVYLEKLIAQGI
jgi:putative ABC transport system ATP-binding protein